MGDEKKIEILSQKVDYTSPYMDIVKYKIKDTKGVIRPYWMLDRKSNFSIIIPLFPDNTTILVGQFRVPIKEYLWEFSMGTVAKATPVKTAEQELREETGVRAGKLESLGSFFLAPGISSQIGHVFLATELVIGEPEPEEDEDLKTKRVNIKEVGEMIKREEIKDGPSIIAWQFFKNRI